MSVVKTVDIKYVIKILTLFNRFHNYVEEVEVSTLKVAVKSWVSTTIGQKGYGSGDQFIVKSSVTG